MQTSIQNLKGKVLEKPENHLWRVNRQAGKLQKSISVVNKAYNIGSRTFKRTSLNCSRGYAVTEA